MLSPATVYLAKIKNKCKVYGSNFTKLFSLFGFCIVIDHNIKREVLNFRQLHINKKGLTFKMLILFCSLIIRLSSNMLYFPQALFGLGPMTSSSVAPDAMAA